MSLLLALYGGDQVKKLTKGNKKPTGTCQLLTLCHPDRATSPRSALAGNPVLAGTLIIAALQRSKLSNANTPVSAELWQVNVLFCFLKFVVNCY